MPHENILFVQQFTNRIVYVHTYLFTLLSHFCSLLLSQCGRSNRRGPVASGRIVGGRVPELQYPWIVYLVSVPSAMQVNSSFQVSMCTGSIISRRAILTAAHCVNKTLLSKTLIYYARNDIFYNETSHVEVENEVSKKIFHPELDGSYNNDVVILITAKPIKFSSFVGPVCLPEKNLKVNMNTEFLFSLDPSEETS